MSQNQAIIAHLKAGNTLTAMDSLQRFRTWRLASRILELRRKGHRIETEMVRIGDRKRIALYRLAR
jgi:hypothetical protein